MGMLMQHGPFLLLLVMGNTRWPSKCYAKLELRAGYQDKIRLSCLLCLGWSIVRPLHSLDKVFVPPTTSTSLKTRFVWHSTSKLIAAALTTSWRRFAYHGPRLPMQNPWRRLYWTHSAIETRFLWVYEQLWYCGMWSYLFFKPRVYNPYWCLLSCQCNANILLNSMFVLTPNTLCLFF